MEYFLFKNTLFNYRVDNDATKAIKNQLKLLSAYQLKRLIDKFIHLFYLKLNLFQKMLYLPIGVRAADTM